MKPKYNIWNKVVYKVFNSYWIITRISWIRETKTTFEGRDTRIEYCYTCTVPYGFFPESNFITKEQADKIKLKIK